MFLSIVHEKPREPLLHSDGEGVGDEDPNSRNTLECGGSAAAFGGWSHYLTHSSSTHAEFKPNSENNRHTFLRNARQHKATQSAKLKAPPASHVFPT